MLQEQVAEPQALRVLKALRAMMVQPVRLEPMVQQVQPALPVRMVQRVLPVLPVQVAAQQGLPVLRVLPAQVAALQARAV